MEQYASLIMIVVMFAIIYFLMIRPENKRKKQAEEMRNSLKKGDQITTIGGIIGKIVMVGEETIVIETSDDRVRMELTKWAVSTTGVQSGENQQASKKEEKPAEEEKAEEAAPAEQETAPAEAPAEKADRDPWDEPEKKD